MFSSRTRGRYDSDVERAFIRAMIDRANASIVANLVGLAILGYSCFVLPFGRALGIAVALRVIAVVVTAFNTRGLLDAIEKERPITGLVNRFALGMSFAGLTWGGLFWAVPVEELTSLGGVLVLTVLLTGVSLVVATASPVPRVVLTFLASFAIPMVLWLVSVSGSLGFGPLVTIGAISFAILSFSFGLTKEAQKTGRLIVENKRLADAHEALAEQLRATAAEKDRLANHDPLTGLMNRRAFQRTIERIASGGERERWSAILVDLDHFKRVNDAAGHAGGDEVLCAAGNLFASTADALPDEAFAARLGGEEFAIMVRGLRDAAVRDVAISLCARLRVVPAPEGFDGIISGSVGTARWQADEPFEKCLARADTALYEAKTTGRDRVVSANGTPDLPYHAPTPPIRGAA